MPLDCILWDFNGTVLDDVQIGIDSINALLQRRNLPLLEGRDAYCANFGFPIEKWYRHLGFDFEKESFEALAVEWVREYESRENQISMVSGVQDVLAFFNEKKIPQIIISASESKMLRRQLKALNMEAYFSQILGSDNIYATGKTGSAVFWRKNHPNARALFIGDTDHDYEVASAIGAACALVAAGHQSYERLMRFSAHADVYHDMKDFYQALLKVQANFI